MTWLKSLRPGWRPDWPALRPYWPGNDLAVLTSWRRHCSMWTLVARFFLNFPRFGRSPRRTQFAYLVVWQTRQLLVYHTCYGDAAKPLPVNRPAGCVWHHRHDGSIMPTARRSRCLPTIACLSQLNSAIDVMSYTLYECTQFVCVNSTVPRWRLHHRQELATLPSVGANP